MKLHKGERALLYYGLILFAVALILMALGFIPV
jgi:hypothetical protein